MDISMERLLRLYRRNLDKNNGRRSIAFTLSARINLKVEWLPYWIGEVKKSVGF